jgi:hypothetical protein
MLYAEHINLDTGSFCERYLYPFLPFSFLGKTKAFSKKSLLAGAESNMKDFFIYAEKYSKELLVRRLHFG